MTTLPVLYILIRNDLASMNPGKAIAQGSHASNAFIHKISQLNQFQCNKDQLAAVREWQSTSTQGFGTVLTLEGKWNTIANTVEEFAERGYLAETVFDDTYPILDGEVVHHIPLHTCAYVFVPDKHTDFLSAALLSSYPLHR